MLLNAKLNDTYQKFLWTEAVHKCKCVKNSMDNKCSTKSPFENYYGKKLRIVGLFSYFGCIAYITKREILRYR